MNQTITGLIVGIFIMLLALAFWKRKKKQRFWPVIMLLFTIFLFAAGIVILIPKLNENADSKIFAGFLILIGIIFFGLSINAIRKKLYIIDNSQYQYIKQKKSIIKSTDSTTPNNTKFKHAFMNKN